MLLVQPLAGKLQQPQAHGHGGRAPRVRPQAPESIAKRGPGHVSGNFLVPRTQATRHVPVNRVQVAVQPVRQGFPIPLAYPPRKLPVDLPPGVL